MRFCNKTQIALLAVALASLGAIPKPDARLLQPSFHATPKSAFEIAEEEQSLVLLVFTAPSCVSCQILRTNTLTSDEFVKNAGALRIAEIDIEADPRIARKFNIRTLPAMMLVTPDHKILASSLETSSTPELLQWIREGRNRLAQGLWEGIAPSLNIEALAVPVEETLDEDGIKRLIVLLRKPDPAERSAAARRILAQRDLAMGPLIEAVADPSLSVRIAVSEILSKIAPIAPSFDPWQAPSNLTDTVSGLKQWWAETGKLPLVVAAPTVDPSIESSVKSALEMLSGDDPLQRTEAMSTLVRHGEAALPTIRDTLKRTAKNAADLQTISLLEDVRWAILIPDAVEHRVSGVRRALARGNGAEKQAAATRLGRAARDAIPALAELVNDADALVVESAVRGLSAIGGRDAVPAMEALLSAGDSNLRMTAAQALGHTKSMEAVTPLLAVLDDTDEVVACAGLAAIEQIHSGGKYSRSKRELSPEVISALKRTLADTRWRVRATCAEVIGKLTAHQVMAELQGLLNDGDGFVVKSGLQALNQIGATPDGERLLALAKRLPSLRAEAIGFMLQNETPETATTVTEIYTSSDIDVQLGILAALKKNSSSTDQKKPDLWKPLLKRATTATDVRLRRLTAQLLARRPANTAAELLTPLLADEDRETRVNAAETLLYVVSGEQKFDYTEGEFLPLEVDESVGNAGKTNKASLNANQMKTWHAAILLRREASNDPAVDLAAYVTGDGKADLPLLLSAFDHADDAKRRRLASLPAFGNVLDKLPWPEGNAAVQRFSSSPVLLSICAVESSRARPEVAEQLLDPGKFRAGVERATGTEMMEVLQILMGLRRSNASLLSLGPKANPIAHALAHSTNEACRAAGIYILGNRDAEKNIATFERSLADSSSWVRTAAIQAFSNAVRERNVLEERIGPLLSNTNKNVKRMAANALLEPEIREAAGLKWHLSVFTYEDLHGGSHSFSTSSDERPLASLEQKPAFLDTVRAQVASAGTDQLGPLAVLLAQYADFSGVDRLISLQSTASDEARAELSDEILTCIALSRDAKYTSFLRQFMETTQEEWELRKVLRALKGMSGSEARQLRLDVNKQLRKTTE